MPEPRTSLACIGLKVRTGRAIAVVLAGPTETPSVIKRSEISLIDPGLPATAQPYHVLMELPWDQAKTEVEPLATAIQAVASRSLAEMVRELNQEGLEVPCVGITGAADRKLERIGNPHIRAHAAEGVLFRQVLEAASEANGLARFTFPEKGLEERAAAELGLSTAKLTANVKTLGRSVGPPWRANERMAATAAWIVLSSLEA